MKARVILGAVLVLVSAYAGRAHVGSSVFPVWELPAHALPDLHDGTVGDWEDVVPEASVYLMDFEGVHGAGFDLASLAGRTFLGWSDEEQRIYFAIERIDDVYINLYEGGDPYDMARHDCAEIMIDADHTGGNYTPLPGDGYSEEEAAEVNGSQAQLYYLIAESADDELIGLGNERKRWAARLPWAEIDGSQVGGGPNYSLIEGFITPWDALASEGPEQSERSSLHGGKIIGFQVVLFDVDTEPGEYDAIYSIAADDLAWRDASRMADAMLMPLGGGSVVMQDSWARIKASFR